MYINHNSLSSHGIYWQVNGHQIVQSRKNACFQVLNQYSVLLKERLSVNERVVQTLADCLAFCIFYFKYQMLNSHGWNLYLFDFFFCNYSNFLGHSARVAELETAQKHARYDNEIIKFVAFRETISEIQKWIRFLYSFHLSAHYNVT